MLLGSVYASIAGDHRYGTTLAVLTDGATLELVLDGSAPVGGMDGPGGQYALPRKVVGTLPVQPGWPAQLLKAIRGVLRGRSQDPGVRLAGDIIASYGKPTKRFCWRTANGSEFGLNAALAARAFEHCVGHNAPQQPEGE